MRDILRSLIYFSLTCIGYFILTDPLDAMIGRRNPISDFFLDQGFSYETSLLLSNVFNPFTWVPFSVLIVSIIAFAVLTIISKMRKPKQSNESSFLESIGLNNPVKGKQRLILGFLFLFATLLYLFAFIDIHIFFDLTKTHLVFAVLSKFLILVAKSVTAFFGFSCSFLCFVGKTKKIRILIYNIYLLIITDCDDDNHLMKWQSISCVASYYDKRIHLIVLPGLLIRDIFG